MLRPKDVMDIITSLLTKVVYMYLSFFLVSSGAPVEGRVGPEAVSQRLVECYVRSGRDATWGHYTTAAHEATDRPRRALLHNDPLDQEPS